MNILNLQMTAKQRNKTDCWVCLYIFICMYVYVNQNTSVWDAKLSTQTLGEAGPGSCPCWVHHGKRNRLLSFLSLLSLLSIRPSSSPSRFATINCRNHMYLQMRPSIVRKTEGIHPYVRPFA